MERAFALRFGSRGLSIHSTQVDGAAPMSVRSFIGRCLVAYHIGVDQVSAAFAAPGSGAESHCQGLPWGLRRASEQARTEAGRASRPKTSPGRARVRVRCSVRPIVRPRLSVWSGLARGVRGK